MGVKDAAGISRPGQFEKVRDEDGNTYVPVSGRGDHANMSVNGSKETIPARTSNPDSMRWRAEAEGLIKPRQVPALLVMRGRR